MEETTEQTVESLVARCNIYEKQISDLGKIMRMQTAHIENLFKGFENITSELNGLISLVKEISEGD